MSRRRSPLRAIFFLILISSCCISFIIIASVLTIIPQRAEQVFGPPTSHLNTIDLVYLSAILIIHEDKLTSPSSYLEIDHLFIVPIGESATSVSQRLYSAGLISDTRAFLTYLEYSGLDTTIQAGEYEFTQTMSPLEIAHKLQDATPSHVTFRVLPGWRIEEIAAALPTSGLNITPDEFLSTANEPIDGYMFSPQLPPQATLEGFFFPDTYLLPRESSPEIFINTMLDNFEIKLEPRILQGFNRQGLNIFEGVIMASIVEREAVDIGEMPLIASVFHNRLNASMKLDSDPTVQYALGFSDAQNIWWRSPLSLEDLKIDSRYNTYLYPGLPPGPIANPSLDALTAVAFPDQTTYYYFRATCDESGRHFFAETFEEHLQNDCP